jgi:hypothetical protein
MTEQNEVPGARGCLHARQHLGEARRQVAVVFEHDRAGQTRGDAVPEREMAHRAADLTRRQAAAEQRMGLERGGIAPRHVALAHEPLTVRRLEDLVRNAEPGQRGEQRTATHERARQADDEEGQARHPAMSTIR